MRNIILAIGIICVIAFSYTRANAQVDPECTSVRGDADGNFSVNVTDMTVISNYLFAGGPQPCLDAADANGNGSVSISDIVFIGNWLFQGGPAPSPATACCN